MNDRSLFGITPVVCIVHIFAIVWLVSVYSWDPPQPPPKALVVKTVKLSPPPQLIALEESAPLTPPKVEPTPELRPPEVKPTPELKSPEVKPTPELKPPEVKPSKPLKPKPLPKKPEKKTTPAPAPAPSKPPAKPVNSKQIELLAQAKEKLGKTQKGVATTPGKIENLQIDSVPEASYSDELAYRLKQMLKLPKYGEVKVDLTLDKSGNVLKVAIISAQNEENKTYIEKELPKLKLPAFGNNFPGQENHTFRNLTLIGGL